MTWHPTNIIEVLKETQSTDPNQWPALYFIYPPPNIWQKRCGCMWRLCHPCPHIHSCAADQKYMHTAHRLAMHYYTQMITTTNITYHKHKSTFKPNIIKNWHMCIINDMTLLIYIDNKVGSNVQNFLYKTTLTLHWTFYKRFLSEESQKLNKTKKLFWHKNGQMNVWCQGQR